ELEKLGLRDDVDLYVYEVPVEYQTVQRLIPALWKKHSPEVIRLCHLGSTVNVPTVVCTLIQWQFRPGGGETRRIVVYWSHDFIDKTTCNCDIHARAPVTTPYLCDFTYYTSLYQSRGRSAFVHVPPLGKPYTAEQLGRALQAIIEEMLDVLEHSEDKINCQHEH
ncbi:PGPI peptidase, partial [Nyctiprogne leucopyga]|nr:PGPI peptidase [Nyctiprogne leucopyga]